VHAHALPELLGAGAGAFAFLLVAALIHPGGMGMGDVKLAGVMGLYLGVTVIPALFIAFLSGSLVGVAMLARHGAKGRKKGVPFAPFLALGGTRRCWRAISSSTSTRTTSFEAAALSARLKDFSQRVDTGSVRKRHGTGA